MFDHLKKCMILFLATVVGACCLGGCAGTPEPGNILTEEIVLPGLTKEYDFLFLTDTHVVAESDTDTAQEKESARERAPQFVNEEGTSSKEQFPVWIDHANKTKYDAVLFGGDIIDSPTAGNIDLLGKQTERLKMPYLYTPGNHDWTQPWEYMTATAEVEYLPKLSPYMNDSPRIQVLDVGEIRLIAVDNSSNQIHPEVIDRYEELLQTDKPVIVLLHVPLLTQSVLGRAREVWSTPVVLGGGNYGGIYPDEYSEKFVELTAAADSPVELVLAGHVHFYDKDYIEGEKKVLQIVGPAGYTGSGIHLHLTSGEQ